MTFACLGDSAAVLAIGGPPLLIDLTLIYFINGSVDRRAGAELWSDNQP